MPRLLSHATLHGPIHTPMTGELGRVLQSKADGKNKAVKMTQLDGEVLVEAPSKTNPGKTVSLLIDNSGFTHRVLADETSS